MSQLLKIHPPPLFKELLKFITHYGIYGGKVIGWSQIITPWKYPAIVLTDILSVLPASSTRSWEQTEIRDTNDAVTLLNTYVFNQNGLCSKPSIQYIACCDHKHDTVAVVVLRDRYKNLSIYLIAGCSMDEMPCDKLEKILRMVLNYMASATAIWLWRTSYALWYSIN